MTEVVDTYIPGIDDNKDGAVSDEEFQDMLKEIELSGKHFDIIVQGFISEIGDVSSALSEPLFVLCKNQITFSDVQNLFCALFSMHGLSSGGIPWNDEILKIVGDIRYINYLGYCKYGSKLTDLGYTITYKEIGYLFLREENLFTGFENNLVALQQLGITDISALHGNICRISVLEAHTIQEIKNRMDLIYNTFGLECHDLNDVFYAFKLDEASIDILKNIINVLHIDSQHITIGDLTYINSLRNDEINNILFNGHSVIDLGFVIDDLTQLFMLSDVDKEDIDFYKAHKTDLEQCGISFDLQDLGRIYNPYSFSYRINDLSIQNAKKYKADLENLGILQRDADALGACKDLNDDIFTNYNRLQIPLESGLTSYWLIKNLITYGSIKTEHATKEVIDRFARQMDLSLFDECFESPGAIELYGYLKDNPQTLQLHGKVLNSIDLKIDDSCKCIHFFRGILEMIKSMGTELPAADVNNEEKKNFWSKTIQQYEDFLNQKISMDPVVEAKDKTFDKIFFCGATQDYTEPYKYEQTDGTFAFRGGEDRNGSFRSFQDFKNEIEKFTGDGCLEDVSSTYMDLGDGEKTLNQTNPRNLVSLVKTYAKKYPDQKILVYIGHHGGDDGSAGPLSKQDFLDLATLSPNIKILSDRCNFGYAYDSRLEKNLQENPSGNDDYIYNLQSGVSGPSNKHIGYATMSYFLDGFQQGMGFHEAEIYLRTQYFGALAPMTEVMEYTDESGKYQKKPIGLATVEQGDGREGHTI